MPKCKNCGEWGLFLKLNAKGYCETCEKAKKSAKNIKSIYGNNKASKSNSKKPKAEPVLQACDVQPDSEIALQLFESQCAGGTIGKKAQAILQECNSRQEILLTAIKYCGVNPTDAKSLYIISHCYVWLGAKYRTLAIKYLEAYISAGAVWQGTPNDTIDMDGYSFDQRKASKASVYNYLGAAYEGEYMFEKAEEAYTHAEELEPYFATYSVDRARTFVKRNDLKKALDYLQSKKDTQYYKKNIDEYRLLLDNAIDDINKKIEKGYVYKPRKK